MNLCPLCGGEISLELADWQVPSKWRDVLAHRATWATLAKRFRELRSLDDAARELSMSPDAALRVLDFLCIEVCGCRTVTCVSCLDDYRSEL